MLIKRRKGLENPDVPRVVYQVGSRLIILELFIFTRWWWSNDPVKIDWKKRPRLLYTCLKRVVQIKEFPPELIGKDLDKYVEGEGFDNE